MLNVINKIISHFIAPCNIAFNFETFLPILSSNTTIVYKIGKINKVITIIISLDISVKLYIAKLTRKKKERTKKEVSP